MRKQARRKKDKQAFSDGNTMILKGSKTEHATILTLKIMHNRGSGEGYHTSRRRGLHCSWSNGNAAVCIRRLSRVTV